VRIKGLPGAERPLVQWSLVLLCTVIVGLAAGVIQRERGTRAALREAELQMQQEREAATRTQSQLERQIARERSAREAFEIGLGRERAANTPAGIPLQPGLDPSGHPRQQLRIPADVSRVQLVLPLGSKRYERYRAAIRPWSGGDELWVHAMLRAELDPKRLFVAVPVDVIPRGAYELSLSGWAGDGRREDVATFTFEVSSYGSGR
jgi:hypothetical protein